MSSERRILYVATPDLAEPAITWQVAQVAKALQKPVTVIGVVPRPWFGNARARTELKARLLEVADRLRGHRARIAGVKAELGALAPTVLAYASRTCSALVMLAAGPAAVKNPAALDAGVAAVVRRSRENVWVCKPHADPNLDHILCAADTSRLAGLALRHAVHLSRRFNARLRILSVLPEPTLHDADPELEAHALVHAQKGFLETFDLTGVPVSRATVWTRGAAGEILHDANQFDNGLLVIGAAGDETAARDGLGATVTPVVRQCPSSFLVVRQPPASDSLGSGGTGQARAAPAGQLEPA